LRLRSRFAIRQQYAFETDSLAETSVFDRCNFKPDRCCSDFVATNRIDRRDGTWMPQSGRRPQHQTRAFGDVGSMSGLAPEALRPRPPSERDPIPYALETDWPVGAPEGFEPAHFDLQVAV
jgi:hypothetical protein